MGKVLSYFRDGMTGLVNRMTGAGTNRDPNRHNTYVFHKPSPSELEAIYRSNWIARKIVNIPVDDMLRQGWTWTADDDIITKLEEEEKRLGLRELLREALIRDGVGGGAALYIGTRDTDLEVELRPERLGRGAVEYLAPFHPEDLRPVELSREPRTLGKPTMYRIMHPDTQKEVLIHPSRIIAFRSRPVDMPLSRMNTEEWWGDSRLSNVLSDIGAVSGALTGGARLMSELAVWIFKINGMADTLSSTGGEASIQNFLSLNAQMKSSLNAVAMDSEDDVEVVTASTAGIADTVRSFMQNVAGAADIPYTRFMAASPDGMNATGASDIRNYYDRLAGERGNYVEPEMVKLDRVLIPSALGRYDDKIYRTWKPLWQMSEQEQVDLDQKKMTMFGQMLDKGLVHDHVIDQVTRVTMIESPTFPGAEEAFDEADKMPDPREEEVEDAVTPQAKPGQKPANQAKAPSAEVKLRIVKDAEPSPLYVQRKVLNPAPILKWARSQGLKNLLEADDLHVTVLYSRAPVDWMELGSDFSESELTVAPGGPRMVEQFLEATVLTFYSSSLKWRHEGMVEAGASHDFPTYQPHVTVAYGEQDVDVTALEPYRGEIVLGPEIFEELNDDWAKDEDTVSFWDKAGSFSESKINRHPAGSSKGGQFASKKGAGGGGYAAAYTKANKAHKEAKENWQETKKKYGPYHPTTTAAMESMHKAETAKKNALKEYYANKGTKSAPEPSSTTSAAPQAEAPKKGGYAAAYTKAQKDHKAALENYEQKKKDLNPLDPEVKWAKEKVEKTAAAKKQALKDYYANKGTKAAAEAEVAKPAGLSVQEREANIAAVKAEKNAALKEYKKHPTGSDEKKAALAAYNEKAATEKKMLEGLEKAKAGGSTLPDPAKPTAAAPAPGPSVSNKADFDSKAAMIADNPTVKGLKHNASMDPKYVKEKQLDKNKKQYEAHVEAVFATSKETGMTPNEVAAVVSSGLMKKKLSESDQAAYEKFQAKQAEMMGKVTGANAPSPLSAAPAAPAAFTSAAAPGSIAYKHDMAIQAVVKAHPHPTFGVKEVEATILKGNQGKALGYNEQKLYNTYKESMNPGSTSAKAAGHPSVKPIVKLDISSAFKDIESDPAFSEAVEKFKAASTKSYGEKKTAHLGYVVGITKAIGGDLAHPSKAQTEYASIKETLKSGERAAFTSYSGSAYASLNGNLRNGHPPVGNQEKLIKNLDSAFLKTTADKDFVVQRGLAQFAVEKYIAAGNFKVGATMIDKGYVSTTSNHSTAQGFKGHDGYHMVIRVKKGQSIAPIKALSKFASEEEFLLPRNTAFQIQHIDKTARVIVVDVL